MEHDNPAADELPPALALLPDVNLFLQCRAITNLPWKDLGEPGPIKIYIGPTLQREIDKLKGDGNSRRSQRARDANTIFGKLLDADDETIVLREAEPRVTMTFLPHLDPQRQKSPQLDLTKPDDCHAEEALTFRTTHPTVRTAILTRDTMLLLTARRIGLEAIRVPAHWLLEPEKDDRQKKIEELSRQVKLLQTQHAQISISIRDEHNAEALALSIVEYDPPTSELIERALADFRSHYPRKEDFTKPPPTDQWSLYALTGYPRQYQAPSQDEIEQYHQSYDAWLTGVETFLTELPEQLRMRTCFGDAVFRLENVGTKPARSVQVDFIATPGFLLRPRVYNNKPDDKKEPCLTLPPRPEPPQGKFVDTLSSWAESIAQLQGVRFFEAAAGPTMNIASFLPPKPQDPAAFYYRDGKPSTFVQSLSLTCMNFPHRLEPEDFEFEVQWQSELSSKGGVIRCRVSAENLPEPVEHLLPIRITFERGDIAAAIKRYRPSSLRSLLTKSKPRGQGT